MIKRFATLEDPYGISGHRVKKKHVFVFLFFMKSKNEDIAETNNVNVKQGIYDHLSWVSLKNRVVEAF